MVLVYNLRVNSFHWIDNIRHMHKKSICHYFLGWKAHSKGEKNQNKFRGHVDVNQQVVTLSSHATVNACRLCAVDVYFEPSHKDKSAHTRRSPQKEIKMFRQMQLCARKSRQMRLLSCRLLFIFPRNLLIGFEENRVSRRLFYAIYAW